MEIGAMVFNWRGQWSGRSIKYAKDNLNIGWRKLMYWTLDSMVDSWFAWAYVKKQRTDDG